MYGGSQQHRVLATPTKPTWRGAATPMPLTDVQVRNTRPSQKPQKIFDGDGLFLLVAPNGSRGWRF
jgi:hypothetical protein